MQLKELTKIYADNSLFSYYLLATSHLMRVSKDCLAKDSSSQVYMMTQRARTDRWSKAQERGNIVSLTQ